MGPGHPTCFWPNAGLRDSMTDRPARPPANGDGGLKSRRNLMIGVLAGVIIVVVAAVFLTLTVTVTTDVSGKSLPYITSYHVALPDGEAVTIGSSRIAVMAYNDSVITDVDGNREQLVVGQTRIISPRHAKITTARDPALRCGFPDHLKIPRLDRDKGQLRPYREDFAAGPVLPARPADAGLGERRSRHKGTGLPGAALSRA